MREILELDRWPLHELDRWPLHELDGFEGQALVARCREALRDAGMFSLAALIRPEALETSVTEVAPILDAAAFTHSREHNIYFDDEIDGIDANHPALRRFTTINHTICGDQIPKSVITRIYEWQPLSDFLALAMGKSRLYPMADPLARINVMAYHEGEQLNWHFDRTEFTTTVLLQAPRSGGEFQYRSALRSESDPNYDGVARLLSDRDERVQTLALEPGTQSGRRLSLGGQQRHHKKGRDPHRPHASCRPATPATEHPVSVAHHDHAPTTQGTP